MTTKIIMDTDPGIDDAAAISVAINNPEIELELITTVAGNVTVDKTTKNAEWHSSSNGWPRCNDESSSNTIYVRHSKILR
jgi:inosine-uridine nucleoside N-ribohydrolase